MAATVFVLCAVTSSACALLLGRAWWASRSPFLLVSALSFGFFALNNVLLVVDELVVRDVDLRWSRDLSGFLAVATLAFGLVWWADRR